MLNRILFVIAISANIAAPPYLSAEPPELTWNELPPLPDDEGFAGMFAGISHGTLIAAGGANFPEKPPWDGGAKVWYDTIYLLDAPDGSWRKAATKLPSRLAYGISATWNDAVICVGGDDGTRHFSDCFLMRMEGDDVIIEQLPSLPRPCAHAGGTLLGSTLYIAGGIDAPTATAAMHTFWALDLEDPTNWKELPAWPGPERHQAVVAAVGGNLFMFSGIQLVADDQGLPKRIIPYMRDAYRYTTTTGDRPGRWQRLPDSPRPMCASANPAIVAGGRYILVPGGVDGSFAALGPDEHPGFNEEILAFDTQDNSWHSAGKLPTGASRVTLPMTRWNDRWVLVSGERAPGRRSPKVFQAQE